MTQTQTVATEFTVTGKDKLSDRWTTVHFTDRQLAIDWAAARAFLLPDAAGKTVRQS